MIRNPKFWTCAVLLALLATGLDAQRPRRLRPPQGGRPATPPPEPEKKPEKKKVENWTAIQGGDVYLGTGPVLRRATVLIGDDKIHAVGHDVEVPEGATVLDATDKVVAPGFCIVKARGFGAPSSGQSVKDNLNPYDPQIKLGLAAGITSFLWLSSPGTDTPAGKSAVVKLAWGDLEGMVALENQVVAMRVPLAPPKIREFRKLVRQAREHKEKLKELEGQKGKEPPKPPRGTEEILKLMAGEKRLWISSRGGGMSIPGMYIPGRGGGGFTVSAIRQALEIAEMLGAGVVLDGPTEAWVIPDEIAGTGSLAIVNPREKVRPDPGRPRSTGSNIAMAAILDEAGVAVAVTAPGGRFGGSGIGTGGILGQDLNTPHVDAAFAVRGGLPDRKGLGTLTANAARIMGAEARIGSIEVGKDADVLILDGDPLHYRTFVEIALVNGKVVYEKDKEPFYRHVRR